MPYIPVLVEKIQCNPDLMIIYKIQKHVHSMEKWMKCITTNPPLTSSYV
jgi:hypothetical protein